MKSVFKRLIAIAVVAVLMLSAVPLSFSENPPPGPTPPPDDIAMWIEPTDIDLSTAEPQYTIGYRFNVTVWGKSNVETKGWQFWLRYNGLILNATGAWYCLPDGTGSASGPSEFMTGAGATMPVAPSFKVGRLDFGESWMAAPYVPPKPDGARMAIVEFEILAVPDKGQTLETWLDISWAANPDTSGAWIFGSDGTYYYTAYDAHYTFEWSPPPSPGLMVDPSSRLFDRYTIWNGTTFTETVKLTDLAAAWFLTNVSFTLTYDPAELELVDVTGNTAAWDVALDIDTSVAGEIAVYAETSQDLSGDVDIITVTFNISDQEIFPDVDVLTLGLEGVSAYDHTLEITVDPIVPATITIEGYLAVAMPWMEVKPSETTLNPGGEFVKHTTFQVEVTINRLHFAWKLVGVEFRLLYDDSVLKVVKVEEGPYLSNFAPYGTWFCSYVEPDYYGPHVLVGNLILPNATGQWETVAGDEEGGPLENGTIAIITFKVIRQTVKFPPEIIDTAEFGLFNIRMVDYTGSLIPVDYSKVVNGTYQAWSGSQLGRFIDVYGGASNGGYGPFPDPFPPGYGGQGLNQPMDLVIPQSEVVLYANVSYNYWPVQQKDVCFEVEGPYDHINGELVPRPNHFVLLKETARTDENGVAKITFAMPWPCEDPESLLGVWKVTATVNIRDVVVNDTLYFYYDYLVHIFNVTTDKFYYKHCETVEITIEYGSRSMQEYPALFVAAIKDELNVVIGMSKDSQTVGGAEFCTFATGNVTLSIHVEKWAFAGYADIYIGCYDKDPTEGGFAWYPKVVEEDAIYIEPL